MAKQTNFHAQALDYQVQSKTHAEWVIKKRARRDIKYQFSTHYHPYTDELIETLNRDGLPALLDAKYHEDLAQNLTTWYVPGPLPRFPFPRKKST